MKETKCPTCQHKVDAFTEVTEGLDTSIEQGIDRETQPQEGNLSLCLYCGNLSRFNKDLDLVELSPEEQFEVAKEDADLWDYLMKVRQAIKEVKAER